MYCAKLLLKISPHKKKQQIIEYNLTMTFVPSFHNNSAFISQVLCNPNTDIKSVKQCKNCNNLNVLDGSDNLHLQLAANL